MWYVNKNNQQIGPIDEGEIVRGLLGKIYTSDTPVWRQGMINWLPMIQTDLVKYFIHTQAPPAIIIQPSFSVTNSSILRAVCKCKEHSEGDLVIAIKNGPAENWGCFAWVFSVLIVLLTLGAAAPLVGAYMLFEYLFSPSYRCQYCSAPIEKNQFR